MADERKADSMQTRIAWKYALGAVGALATVSLLGQYGGFSSRPAQAMPRPPQQQAAALQSLRAYLGLSDAQVYQLQQLSNRSLAESKATSDKIRADQAALHEILTSTNQPDNARTGRLVLESTSLRSELEASRQALVEKTTGLLTPDQKQRLATLASTVLNQRRISPAAMPQGWPMIHAASNVGLIAPPGRGERLRMGLGSGAQLTARN